MMIDGSLSLFVFDLFGLSRKAVRQEPKRQLPLFLAKPEKGEDDRLEPEAASERHQSESFFWGMYPVY